MAAAPENVVEEIDEKVLTCRICEQPYDLQVRVPRILPCHHSLCGICIARLREQCDNACPFCRKSTRMSEAFPEDTTRTDLLNCKEDLQKRVLSSRSRQNVCQKHQDEELKFFCTTCKSALCSECAFIEHKNKAGHDIIKLGDVLEQVKREVQSRAQELDNIRESSLQPRAKMAATSLRETEASFKAAEQDIEDVFSMAVNALLDRKTQAMEELKSKWKEDRMVLEDQAMVTDSLVSGAKTSTALGRTVTSMGLLSHVVAQEQELERAIQEARAEGEKPLLSSICYEVILDLSGLMEQIQQVSAPSVTSWSTGDPTPTMTPSTILTPEFWLEPGRCRPGCELGGNGTILYNTRRPQSGSTGQSGPRPFAFLGTCGSVDLTQPALHYWTVTVKVWAKHPGDRCEFGLASLQTLTTCGEGHRVSDHDVNSATLVLVRDGATMRLEGRNWTRDMDTPPAHQRRDVTYTCLWEGPMERDATGNQFCMTLGFLYDNRQPRSPRVLVVETESCRLLGVRRLSPSPDLRPVLRVGPISSERCDYDAILQVETGPAALKDSVARQLQKLLYG